MDSPARPPLSWPAAVAVSMTLGLLAMASLVSLFDGTPDGFLARGPAAVDPDIGEELSTIFDPAVIGIAQRTIHVVGVFAFVAVAFLILRTRSASPVAPLAAVTLVSLSAALFAPLDVLPAGRLQGQLIGAVTTEGIAAFWSSLAGLATLAFLATFPDGRWRPRWTLVPVAIGAGILVGSLVVPGFLDPTAWESWAQWTFGIGMVAPLLWAQIKRMAGERGGAARQVVASLAGAIAAFALLAALRPELQPDSLGLVVDTPRLRVVYAANLVVLLTASIFAFPVTVATSIFRHRMFDLDMLVNRALVYGTVTGLLGAIFLAIVVLVVVVAQAPLTDRSGALGVLMGAVVVITFQPLRRRVQKLVDRRFYRSRYDARQVIDAFGREAGKLIDPERIERTLMTTVDQALGPTYSRVHLPGSDGLTELKGIAVDEVMILDGQVPALDGLADRGAAVIVPLFAGGTTSGMIELGRRSSGSRYTRLDLDLLDQLGRAAGPALQLAHELKIREGEARERERMAHELELAAKIQRDLLPHELPRIDGWSFSSVYRPAREVGGDFFDWIELDDGRVTVVIGDVSDKGIPAALVMATCRTLLRVSAGSDRSPGAVLAEVNDRLQPDIPPAMFVTCLMVTLDPRSGELELANAGHNLPVRCGAHVVEEIVARGMPLGLMESMEYEVVKTHLEPGDHLVLSSDGVTEAHGPDHEMFGTARMYAALLKAGGDLIGSTLEDHARFVGESWQQEDDITMVAVGRSASVADFSGR